MIFPIIVRGQGVNHGSLVNFCVSPQLASEEATIRAKITLLVDALSKIPQPHIRLLKDVPIVIYRNDNGTGGWVAPLERRRGRRESIPNDRYTGWLRGRRGARFGVREELSSLPHSNGIIHMTTKALYKPGNLCQFTILHETGHCVDYHLSLESEPMNGDTSYRNGNQAYRGQRYRNTGYNEFEFKAETYSRLFISPNSICRRNGARPATPMCLNSSNHRNCNRRLQRDLANTPAFRSVGAGLSEYLPLASIPTESTNRLASLRGPTGLDEPIIIGEPKFIPHERDRTPGPEGLA